MEINVVGLHKRIEMMTHPHKGAAILDHAGGTASDNHSLPVSPRDNYLCYSHKSAMGHHTDFALESCQSK